jgi:hypothetical protein
MSASGIKNVYDAQKHGGGQVPMSQGLAKFGIGVALLSLGAVIQSGSLTLFGSDQASGVGELGF